MSESIGRVGLTRPGGDWSWSLGRRTGRNGLGHGNENEREREHGKGKTEGIPSHRREGGGQTQKLIPTQLRISSSARASSTSDWMETSSKHKGKSRWISSTLLDQNTSSSYSRLELVVWGSTSQLRIQVGYSSQLVRPRGMLSSILSYWYGDAEVGFSHHL
jgi:hypothetical protein